MVVIIVVVVVIVACRRSQPMGKVSADPASNMEPYISRINVGTDGRSADEDGYSSLRKTDNPDSFRNSDNPEDDYIHPPISPDFTSASPNFTSTL